jgi:hypothetical protein
MFTYAHVCSRIGAGLEHFEGIDLGKDPSGNKRLPGTQFTCFTSTKIHILTQIWSADVGLWLKEKTKSWWKEKGRNLEV